MALFVLGDTHLSLGASKPMDIFPGWNDYVERLEKNWRKLIRPEDTIVLAGDISWAMRLTDTRRDFAFLQSLPGQKIIMKGNHDYWWSTANKMNAYLKAEGFDTLHILHNNSYSVEGYAICGTRGWLFDVGEPHDEKVMNREIGRLREIAFRGAGGGTGKELDIDAEDLAEDGYYQLIVWDPAAEEIVGGYRFIICTDEYPRHLSTEHYFRFSDRFRQEVLPYTIELGRSFVQPRYQRTRDAKSLYALDNLWDGLGALIVENPDKQYFFGKVTMYGHYDKEARNILMYFLQKYFPDRDGLLEPLYPVEMNIDVPAMERIFAGGSYMDDYRTLVNELRKRDEFIPPMINSYMNLSPSMKVFSTVHNPDFGEVEETGILVRIKDIYPEKAERHTRGLLQKLKKRIKSVSGGE